MSEEDEERKFRRMERQETNVYDSDSTETSLRLIAQKSKIKTQLAEISKDPTADENDKLLMLQQLKFVNSKISQMLQE